MTCPILKETREAEQRIDGVLKKYGEEGTKYWVTEKDKADLQEPITPPRPTNIRKCPCRTPEYRTYIICTKCKNYYHPTCAGLMHGLGVPTLCARHAIQEGNFYAKGKKLRNL
jgi:hypothetical protein